MCYCNCKEGKNFINEEVVLKEVLAHGYVNCLHALPIASRPLDAWPFLVIPLFNLQKVLQGFQDTC